MFHLTIQLSAQEGRYLLRDTELLEKLSENWGRRKMDKFHANSVKQHPQVIVLSDLSIQC